MHPDIESVLFSQEQIQKRIEEMGAQITADYEGKELVLISVLRGAFVFTADLARYIKIPCVVDFVAASSYGAGTVSSGKLVLKKDITEDIRGKYVLICEDVLDTGNTLSNLMHLFADRGAADIKLCTFLDKPSRRIQKIESDYKGFTIPDAFVVGYGLDYAERYRNLPYIGILKPSVYGG